MHKQQQQLKDVDIYHSILKKHLHNNEDLTQNSEFIVVIGLTSASELSVFSPPERLEMFFQLFFGGRTLNTTPSVNGSKLSTNSNSASPPRVII